MVNDQLMLRSDKSQIKCASDDWSASIPACIERPLRARTSLVDIQVSGNVRLFRVKKRRSLQAGCLRSSHNAPVCFCVTSVIKYIFNKSSWFICRFTINNLPLTIFKLTFNPVIRSFFRDNHIVNV